MIFLFFSSSLACLEPKLELFEVWEINVRQIIIIANGINSQTPKLQRALARVLDELERNQKKRKIIYIPPCYFAMLLIFVYKIDRVLLFCWKFEYFISRVLTAKWVIEPPGVQKFLNSQNVFSALKTNFSTKIDKKRLKCRTGKHPIMAKNIQQYK